MPAREGGRERRVWLEFLTRTAVRPFGEVEVTRDQDPLQLLHGVYWRIQEELEGSPHRKTVEAAVDSFALHPETQAWLEQYRQDR